MSKADRIKTLQDWRREDLDESEEWRKRTAESYRFYTNYRQWEKADIDQLDAEGRPHLSIPLVFPIVNFLVGDQIDNSQDFRLFPRRGGSAAVARLGTELLKHTMDISDGEENLTEVYQDGLIGAVGVVGVERRRQYDKINGEVLIRKKSPFAIVFDQNAIEYDFDESGRRLFEEIWMSAEEIKLGFGRSVKDIVQATGDPRFDEDKFSIEDDYSGDRTLTPERRDQYLVNRAYWRRWIKNVYLVDLVNWSTRLLTSKKMIDLARSAIEVHRNQMAMYGQEPRMKIIERAGWMLYETYFVGDMELSHRENPWNGIMEFPLKRFSPYWADGYPLGVIDNLKDMQREVNKRVSQELHILNTTANTGWEIADGTDAEAVRELKEQGGKSGFVLDKSKFGGEAEKIQPNQLSAGHAYMAEQHEKYIDRVSGVDPNLRGIKTGNESGRALGARFMAGSKVSRGIIKNFNRTQKSVAKFLWDVIRQKDETGQSIVYSHKEIESIVQEQNIREFIKVDQMTGKQVIDLSPFYADDIGTYGIKVATSPSAPTVRMENLEYLMRIAETYGRLYNIPVIPPDFLIEMTDIARKDELIERLQRNPPIPIPQKTGAA